ncbi:hypothetical protein [Nonomuraea recticatena]
MAWSAAASPSRASWHDVQPVGSLSGANAASRFQARAARTASRKVG